MFVVTATSPFRGVVSFTMLRFQAFSSVNQLMPGGPTSVHIYNNHRPANCTVVALFQCMQHGAATLPPPHRRPPRRPSQGSSATVDRRRTHGPPPPRLEDHQPPDATRSPMIGSRPEQNALIGYSADKATLIGCRLDESAF